MENDAVPVLPQTSLRDALEALNRSPVPTLPILDPETGQILAILARQEAVPPPPPPRLGGMATPLGVYLHDGVLSGGAGFWGLVLTGVTMSCLALAATALTHALGQALAAHPNLLNGWQAAAPLGLRLWLTAISSWLPLPLVFLLLRLAPLSGTHAAEHQVVHCVERHAPLVLSCVRSMPRVHPRCGTNLFAGFTLFLLTFLGVFCAVSAAHWPLLDSVSLAAMLSAPVTLIFWRRVGGWVQYWFATRPATDKQIAGAIHAAEQVLSRRHQLQGLPVRFAPLRRVWTMGLVQILLGYMAVFAVVTLLGTLWPGLANWMEM